MEISSLTTKFIDYLVENNIFTKEEIETRGIADSDVSLFMYLDEFKEYLVEENYADSDIFLKSYSDIQEMEIIDGKLLDKTEAQTANEIDETTDISDTTPAETEESENIFLNLDIEEDLTESETLNTNKQNNVKDINQLYSEIYSNSDVLRYLDEDGDGVLSDEEKIKFEKFVKSNGSGASYDALKDLYDRMLNDEFDMNEYMTFGTESEKAYKEAKSVDINNDTNTNNNISGGSSVSGSNGGSGDYASSGNSRINSTKDSDTTEKSLENMTKSELEDEKTTAQSSLEEKQNNVASFLDGSAPELQQLQEDIDNAYEAYHNQLKELDEDMANRLDEIVNKETEKESEISAKEQEVFNQEQTVSTAENQVSNAEATLSAAEASLSSLEAVSVDEDDEKGQAGLAAAIAAAEAAVEAAETALETAENNLQEQKSILDVLNSEKSALDSELTTITSDKAKLQTEITQKHSEVQQAQNDYNNAKNTYNTQKSAFVDTAKQEASDALDYINDIDSSINKIENNEMQRELKFSRMGNLFDNDSELTLSELILDGEHMPYRFIGPENPDPNVDYPVILYLQGANGTDGTYNRVGGLTDAVLNSQMENFNGYIIIPQCTGYTDSTGKYRSEFAASGWSDLNNVNNLRSLMDSFTSSHNVDMSNIAIAGCSDGARGALVAASSSEFQNYFCGMTIMSGFNLKNIDYSKINIPVYGYSGSENGDGTPGIETPKLFNEHFNISNYTQINGLVHSVSAQSIHNYDANNNGCPDWIEQLFGY